MKKSVAFIWTNLNYFQPMRYMSQVLILVNIGRVDNSVSIHVAYIYYFANYIILEKDAVKWTLGWQPEKALTLCSYSSLKISFFFVSGFRFVPFHHLVNSFWLYFDLVLLFAYMELLLGLLSLVTIHFYVICYSHCEWHYCTLNTPLTHLFTQGCCSNQELSEFPVIPIIWVS